MNSKISKFVAAGTALAMGASMVVAVPSAGAASKVNTVTTGTAVTASVTPASQTAVQMLGMSCLEDPSSGSAPTSLDNYWGSGTPGGALKYIIDADPAVSQSPDPYAVNALKGASPSVVYYATHIGAGAFNTGIKQPKSALAEIGENEYSDQVWSMLPDVLVGTHATKAGDQTNYRDELNNSVNIINGKASKEGVEAFGDGSYNPQAVDYNSDTMATIIDSTYRIAEAAKVTVTASKGAKMLRFGDADSALDIATTYEEYVKGSQGYVLYRLQQEKKDKKTVAVVASAEETEAGTVFKLTQPLNTSNSAKENRAVEALKNVANIMPGDENNQATLADLEKADMILVDISVGAGSKQTAIVDKLGSLKAKTYWSSAEAGTAQGTIYDYSRNNTEIGQNYGRLIACVYPEYLDQSDMVTFWFDKFLHVKSSMLSTIVPKAMSGTRNWDNSNDYTTWTSSTIKGYNAANVQAKLETGSAYLCSLKDSQFTTGYMELLKPTTYITTLNLKVPTAPKATKITSAKASGKKIVVKFSKVSGATKYQVSYSTTKTFKKSTTKNVTTTSATIKNLKKGTYYVKVRAVKTVGTDVYASKWTSAKKVKVS